MQRLIQGKDKLSLECGYTDRNKGQSNRKLCKRIKESGITIRIWNQLLKVGDHEETKSADTLPFW